MHCPAKDSQRIRKLEYILTHIGIREWIGKDAKIRVQYVSGVRDWGSWLSKAPVTYAGGLRDDETGVHCLIMMPRQDLPSNIRIIANGRGACLEEHPLDTIILLKRHAADDQLCQEAVLGFPHRYLDRMGLIPREPRPLKPVKAEKRKDYLSLATVLLSKQPTEATRRAVEFLVRICDDLRPQPVPFLGWLENPHQPQLVEVGQPSMLSRLAPHMKFNAHVRP
ncbi:unnamed protein product [Durusdinium trenchii]|uniref:Uncharacterized protein n=1 Tax=Durusdinium trenchii TaxID=1381693 RepID=A0ABP0KRT2_9DINO